MNILQQIFKTTLSILMLFAEVVGTTSAVLADVGGRGNIFHDGRSSFSNGKWSIYQECGEDGTFLGYGTSKPLRLLNETTEIKSNGKKIYTWVQKGAQYKITWNPRDPGFARLEIINNSGIKIVNTLLKVGSLPVC